MKSKVEALEGDEEGEETCRGEEKRLGGRKVEGGRKRGKFRGKERSTHWGEWNRLQPMVGGFGGLGGWGRWISIISGFSLPVPLARVDLLPTTE